MFNKKNMNTDDQRFGAWGETLAVKYLLGKNYEILQRNWRDGHKELDIVARHNDLIVFFEVKTRLDIFLSGEAGVLHRDQVRNLRYAILSYCFRYRLDPEKTRLDLLLIQPDRVKRVARVKHFSGLY